MYIHRYECICICVIYIHVCHDSCMKYKHSATHHYHRRHHRCRRAQPTDRLPTWASSPGRNSQKSALYSFCVLNLGAS